jgi:hypothetical protein
VRECNDNFVCLSHESGSLKRLPGKKKEWKTFSRKAS